MFDHPMRRDLVEHNPFTNEVKRLKAVSSSVLLGKSSGVIVRSVEPWMLNFKSTYIYCHARALQPRTRRRARGKYRAGFAKVWKPVVIQTAAVDSQRPTNPTIKYVLFR
jgi:hypothetical protein